MLTLSLSCVMLDFSSNRIFGHRDNEYAMHAVLAFRQWQSLLRAYGNITKLIMGQQDNTRSTNKQFED